MIAAGGDNKAVDIWLTDPVAAQEQICAEVGTPISRAAWNLYLPDQPYDPPCSVG